MNTMVPNIYVVDDDASIREAVASLVRSVGFRIRTFSSAQEAWVQVQKELPDCVVLDVDLPGLSGFELQERLTRAHILVPIIFLTGKGDIPMSVRAIKAGAFEFLTKPFVGEYLLQAIRQTLDQPKESPAPVDDGGIRWRVTRTEITADYPRPRRRPVKSQPEMVGDSAAMESVLSRVDKVAPTDSTVLITGETGSGKELVARAIHHRSRRASGPFVAVNCGAIPPSLIASELFGHEKGAFTGALQRRLGRFEAAGGGTIFLDEIGELAPEIQVSLLRVLQEREFERVGGSDMIRANVRVIAATHRDLKTAIAADKFRSDLFYRLNVFPIAVPALRDRTEDIRALVDFFIERFATLTEQPVKTICPSSLKLLKAYSWPGNIRELQNVIERSMITSEGGTLIVEENCLRNDSAGFKTKPEPAGNAFAAREKEVIEEALRESKGRISGPWGAAAMLGVPPSTLESKIQALKIDKHRFKSPVRSGFDAEVAVVA